MDEKPLNKLAIQDFPGETYILVDGRVLGDDEELICVGHGIFFGDTRPSDKEWFFNVMAEGTHEKCLLMSCNCGQADCMSLWGTIVIEPAVVHWKDLTPRRGEAFDRTFTFNRKQYEDAIADWKQKYSLA